MADKGALRVYTELPSWAKGVVVVGGLVVGYLAVTSILKSIKAKKNKEESLAGNQHSKRNQRSSY